MLSTRNLVILGAVMAASQTSALTLRGRNLQQVSAQADASAIASGNGVASAHADASASATGCSVVPVKQEEWFIIRLHRRLIMVLLLLQLLQHN